MSLKIIPSVDDWQTVAEEILATLPSDQSAATVIALSGDLGVGKTTFVKTLASCLGIKEPVTSPTFTIFKRYQTETGQFDSLVHMDAYRLESVTELEPLNFSELLETAGNLICIEWAEKIKTALPVDTHYYTLGINPEGQHTIQSQS